MQAALDRLSAAMEQKGPARVPAEVVGDVLAGRTDGECLALLIARSPAPADLRAAEALSAASASRGYPYATAYRVIKASRNPSVAIEPESEDEAWQREVWHMPKAQGFEVIANIEPELQGLKREVLDDPSALIRTLTFKESGIVGQTLPRNMVERRRLAMRGLRKRIDVYVGPKSNAQDVRLRSAAARRVVFGYLSSLIRDF